MSYTIHKKGPRLLLSITSVFVTVWGKVEVFGFPGFPILIIEQWKSWKKNYQELQLVNKSGNEICPWGTQTCTFRIFKSASMRFTLISESVSLPASEANNLMAVTSPVYFTHYNKIAKMIFYLPSLIISSIKHLQHPEAVKHADIPYLSMPQILKQGKF